MTVLKESKYIMHTTAKLYNKAQEQMGAGRRISQKKYAAYKHAELLISGELWAVMYSSYMIISRNLILKIIQTDKGIVWG